MPPSRGKGFLIILLAIIEAFQCCSGLVSLQSDRVYESGFIKSDSSQQSGCSYTPTAALFTVLECVSQGCRSYTPLEGPGLGPCPTQAPPYSTYLGSWEGGL